MSMIMLLLVFIVIGLGLIIPSLAVSVRRLHDTDRSGWWIGGYYALAFLSGLVPESSTVASMIAGLAVFGLAIAILVFLVLPGTTGPNRFGDDPKGAGTAEVFA